MKNLILIPIIFLSLTLSAQTYIPVKPSQLPAASTINPTDLFILNQGTTTKKVTYSILNTVLKDTFATKNALRDTAAAIRSSGGGSGSPVDTSKLVTKYDLNNANYLGGLTYLNTKSGNDFMQLILFPEQKYLALNAIGLEDQCQVKLDTAGLFYSEPPDTSFTTPFHFMTEAQTKREINAVDGGWRKREDATVYVFEEGNDSIVINDTNGEVNASLSLYSSGDRKAYIDDSGTGYFGGMNVFGTVIYNDYFMLRPDASLFNFGKKYGALNTGLFMDDDDTIKWGRYQNATSENQGDYFYSTKSGSIGIVSNGVKTFEADSSGIITTPLVRTTSKGIIEQNYDTDYPNTLIGASCGINTVSGEGNNSGYGSVSLLNTTTGIQNTAIGSYSLSINATGSNNLALGYSAGRYLANKNNRLFINTLHRDNELGDTTKSIIYGVQDNDVANQKLYLNANVNIAEHMSFKGTYASIYRARSLGDTTQSIPNGTTPTKVLAFSTNGNYSNCTPDKDNDKITVTKKGRYLVNLSLSYASGTATVNWTAYIFVNGVESDNIHSTGYTATANDKRSTSTSGIIDVQTVPCDVDYRVTHSSGASVNLTFSYVNLSLTYIGD